MRIRLTDHSPSPKAQSRSLHNACAERFSALPSCSAAQYRPTACFCNLTFIFIKERAARPKKTPPGRSFSRRAALFVFFRLSQDNAGHQSRSLRTIGQVRAHTAPLSGLLFDRIFAGSTVVHALNVPGFRIGDVVHLIVSDRHLKILFGFGELFDLLIDAVLTI